MKKSIRTYVNSIISDQVEYILNGEYKSISEYLIDTAEYGAGFYEYFDSEELEGNLGEPTIEQVEELKSYLSDNYNFLPYEDEAQHLIGALFAFNADPCIMEDIDFARMLACDIDHCKDSNVLTSSDGIEFEDACAKLDLTPDKTRKIHSYLVSGGWLLIAYAQDWEY